MKLTVSKAELLKGLEKTEISVAVTTTLPVLMNFLLEAKGKKLKITSTDLETSTACGVEAEVEEAGEISVAAKRFFNIIRELSDKTDIKLEVKKGNLEIKNEKTKFTLAGIDKDEFPKLPEYEKEATFSIKQDVLIDAIKTVMHCMSNETNRYIMTGINFVMENKDLVSTATDGRRLSYIKLADVLSKDIKKTSIVIPSKAISAMLKVMSAEKDLTTNVHLQENQIVFDMGDVVFMSRLVDGTFPDVNTLINVEHTKTVKADVQDFLSANKQMLVLIADSIGVKNTFNGNKNEMAVASSVGSGEITIDLEQGADLSVVLNPAYMIDSLKVIDTQKFTMKMHENLSPIIIQPEGKENIIHIVMPMRSN